MSITVRKSTINDLDLLEMVELASFPEFQQLSRRSLRLSLKSPSQEVWIIEQTSGRKKIAAGCMILHLHSRTLRIYSLGILPGMQGKGLGGRLLTHACNLAMARGYEKITLEARKKDSKLLKWYELYGFVKSAVLPGYYARGEDAVRMVFTVSRPKTRAHVCNLVVVDYPSKWEMVMEGVKVISAKNYISENGFHNSKNVRVFNLCNSYRYQSAGYYVSLLASAREHRAIPSVTTMRDFKNLSVVQAIASDIEELIQSSLSKIDDSKYELNIYFGQTTETTLKILASKLYLLFETPLLQVSFVKTEKWMIRKVVPLSLNKIDEADHEKVHEFAMAYFSKKRFKKPRLKHYKYDLAILINPSEPNPPSCPSALRYFKEAANKIGFYVDFITKDNYEDICEYDALFIRETTSVNDHTWEFSRRAYAEGLVVIDDPWSILRCSNKIFLYERMKQNKVPIPNSWVFTKGAFKPSQTDGMVYPLVLKQPDSAFSLGVIKVNNKEELAENVKKLFKKSDLVIAQEFIYSEYDWRIGILDQLPLFACKYYMAKNHWQIYNWQASKEEGTGDSETVPLEEVPPQVLKVAVKAASLMGDGLYGVDLKMVGNKVYLIEVNDNPNIDNGIEDLVLKDALYEKIMQSLFNRIEVSRNMSRLVAMEPNKTNITLV
jgi:glutathione synthase/RimK-type ligase-like ATP-grasp enzyme/ribosomal protein S18 acetylase RimI-like enzyme